VPNNNKLQIPDFVKYLAIAGVIVAILLAIVLWFNRGAQVRLEARILKTRLIPTDDNACFAVLEARVKNPSNVTFVVKDVHFKVLLADGTTLDGDQVAQMDLDRVLDFLKIHGPRYNPVLKPRDSFTGSSQTNRTIVASFPRSASEIGRRKGFIIDVDDLDGAVTHFAEAGAESK
jgi:hypothetical protein